MNVHYMMRRFTVAVDSITIFVITIKPQEQPSI